MALFITCTQNEENQYWDIKLRGEVDISSAAKFRTALTESYQTNPADIRLDATELSYIDSTGLGVIIGAFGRMQENKHCITIENPKENVKKLLQITCLDKILCANLT